MILDIPTPDDFKQSGTAYLNLAWSTVVDLALNLNESDPDFREQDGDVSDEYWTAAQRPLATAISLLQQGTEFLIKARVAELSPFLLINQNPSDWPRRSATEDIEFAKFKTIDAQDLVRVHDTIASTRLPESFANLFNELRRRRNTIMHTVDQRMRFKASEVIESILEISENLLGHEKWVPCRRSFLEIEPISVAHSGDHVDGALIRELLMIIELLPPSRLLKYFDFRSRQRRYICYECNLECRDWDIEARTSQLRPNSPRSKTVFCFVCQRETPVVRRRCREPECPGNVLDAGDKVCLTCYADQD